MELRADPKHSHRNTGTSCHALTQGDTPNILMGFRHEAQDRIRETGLQDAQALVTDPAPQRVLEEREGDPTRLREEAPPRTENLQSTRQK